MIVSANGIVANEYSDVLLVQRDDTRTFAPPGGACEIDELPPQAAAREVQEETGLIVHPVRLVGLYYLPFRPNPYLFLSFRCIQKGGELTTSEESPRAGFFKSNPLPAPMLAMHKEQIRQAFDHRGGPPYWGEHQVGVSQRAGMVLLNRVIYPLLQFRRSRLGLADYSHPPQWRVGGIIIARDSAGRILLQKDEVTGAWSLPSTAYSITEPPWITTNRLIQNKLDGKVLLDNLSGIYLRKGKQEMRFVFTGSMKEGATPSFTGTHFIPKSLPENIEPDHLLMIKNAQNSGTRITHHLLT